MVIDSDSLRDLLNHFLLINIFTPAWLTVVFLTKDNGRKAIEILREHYIGKVKPRMIALYTGLTSSTMADDCSLTACFESGNSSYVTEKCKRTDK